MSENPSWWVIVVKNNLFVSKYSHEYQRVWLDMHIFSKWLAPRIGNNLGCFFHEKLLQFLSIEDIRLPRTLTHDSHWYLYPRLQETPPPPPSAPPPLPTYTPSKEQYPSDHSYGGDPPYKKVVKMFFLIANLGLATMMGATGVLGIAAADSASDTGVVFIGLYMLVFSLILLIFEINQLRPNSGVDNLWKRNFGFLYGPVGKGLYMIFIGEVSLLLIFLTFLVFPFLLSPPLPTLPSPQNGHYTNHHRSEKFFFSSKPYWSYIHLFSCHKKSHFMFRIRQAIQLGAIQWNRYRIFWYHSAPHQFLVPSVFRQIREVHSLGGLEAGKTRSDCSIRFHLQSNKIPTWGNF